MADFYDRRFLCTCKNGLQVIIINLSFLTFSLYFLNEVINDAPSYTCIMIFACKYICFHYLKIITFLVCIRIKCDYPFGCI